MNSYNEVVTKHKTEESNWVSQLKKAGIKAAHPDDGWVNRNANKIHFSYPQFDDGVEEGDLIALGWPDKWRIVKVSKIEESLLGLKYYWFVEV